MDVPAEMAQALEDNRAAVFGVRGVSGLEIGADEAGESLTFRVLVADPSDPPADLPASIGGYPVLVIAGSPRVGSLPDLHRSDPVLGGVETSRTTGIAIPGGQQLGAGTLGCVVRDAASRELRGLSCAHVLCGSNPTTGQFAVGDTIDQPAPSTNPPPSSERLGDLVAWSFPETPPLFPSLAGPFPSGDCDAAVCTLGRPAFPQQIIEIGSVNGWRSPRIGDAVQKRGKVTGLTFGTVTGVLGSYLVSDDHGNPMWWMLGQVRIEVNRALSSVFSQPGDSGSLVVHVDGQAAGLLWGGEHGGSSDTMIGYATDIFTVLTLLHLTID